MRPTSTILLGLLSVAWPGNAFAQTSVPSQQIDGAVHAAPAEMRPGATVLGYDVQGDLITLRSGGNGLVCLADDPASEGFEVACYHESLEPYMARGRELRAQGVKDGAVDSVRVAEADAGQLPLPSAPAMLYVLSAPAGAFDPANGTVRDGSLRWAVYVPYATEEATGISVRPVPGAPWLMFPGSARAHIMITPERR